MSSRNLGDAPAGDVKDNSYVSRPGEKHQPIPVDSDDMKVEDPIDANIADSDRQLERDDADAIDEDNILDERTRGAKPSQAYREPGDEEGIPDDTGRSAGAQ